MIVLISVILIYLILIKIPVVGEIATVALIFAFIVFIGSVLIRANDISNEQQRTEYTRWE